VHHFSPKVANLINPSIKSLALFFGPILLPKAIAYYRSVRAAPVVHGIPIRPIPPKVARALLILFVTSLAFLVTTLPFSSPENIFSHTASRLQIPTDVLFTRLASLRPTGLTSADETLRSKVNSLESRLLYFQFGPDVIRDCQFCNAEDPNSYLYYALPAIVAPHLFNLCVLALVTSGLFTGKEGGIWRTTATITALAVALVDVYFVSTYKHQANARATRLEDIDTFFWKERIYRGITLSAMDGFLGWLLYLSSTNRAFLNPPSTAERVETTTRILEGVTNKMNSVTIMRNTIERDEELKARSNVYWAHEGRVMGEAMEDKEVVEGVNNALENRINLATISKEAETYARSVVGNLGLVQRKV
jgi:hypothetical protein